MKSPLLILAASLLALGLTACQRPASSSQAAAAKPMQLKLYDVPPQRSEALMTALRSVIADGKSSRVSQPLPGKLLVAAPADEQASIGAAIASLGKAPVPAIAHAQYRVHFWLVDMLPGPGTDSASLKPLSGTLDTLRKRMGPSHFILADDAQVATLTGHRAHELGTASRNHFEFWIPTAGNDQVQLVLQYGRPGDDFGLKTTVSLTPGHYMVLAQTAMPGHMPGQHAVQPQGTMRLLVVRADPLDSGAR